MMWHYIGFAGLAGELISLTMECTRFANSFAVKVKVPLPRGACMAPGSAALAIRALMWALPTTNLPIATLNDATSIAKLDASPSADSICFIVPQPTTIDDETTLAKFLCSFGVADQRAPLL